MPIFGTFRHSLSWIGVVLLLGTGVSARANYFDRQCMDALLGVAPELLVDGAIQKHLSPDARKVTQTGFDYIEDSICSGCMLNVHIQDPQAITRVLLQRYSGIAQSMNLEAEIRLVLKFAARLSANVNVEMLGDRLRFGLDMNGGNMVRVTHLEVPKATEANYLRLQIDFTAGGVELKKVILVGQNVGGRTLILHQGNGHGHGLLVVPQEDPKHVVIDTVDAKAGFFVGEDPRRRSSDLRMMLEIARQLAWNLNSNVQSVLFHAKDVDISAKRDQAFQ